MQIVDSKKVCLEFKLRIFEFWTSGGALFDSNNIVEVQTPGLFFCRYATRYLPRLKVLIFCHKWDPPHLWGVFWYHVLSHGFQQVDLRVDVAPCRRKDVEAARTPEISALRMKSWKEVSGETKGRPPIPHSDFRDGSGGPPLVRTPSGGGGLDQYVRVVP